MNLLLYNIVLYLITESLPYHRVRQLHTAVPQRFPALALTKEMQEEIEDIEQEIKAEEIIPVAMHFEHIEQIESDISSYSSQSSLENDAGQAYSDFKSSVFMTHHEDSAFFEQD